MYCNLQEAYNTPLKKQLNNIEKKYKDTIHKQALQESVENYQQKHSLVPPHQTGQCSADTSQYTNKQQPYFNAQGDMETRNCDGTNLADLKTREIFDDIMSETDTLPTIDTNTGISYATGDIDGSILTIKSKSNKNKKNKVVHSHDYYIYRFMRELKKDDLTSLIGEELDDVYEHVKGCKFCRSEIRKKMLNTYDKTVSITEEKEETTNNTEIKDIIIIVLVGIIVIFILDLFYKLYKAVNK